MSDSGKSIENLQQEVNQVKIDLDSLKKLTDESIKQNKAKEAAEKVKSTKESINKKLDELKWRTDATSIENAAKLEAMLKSLEALEKSSDELQALKITVTAPVEAPKNKEAVDNTADFENVKKGIAEIKVMVTDVQKIIDDYKVKKSTLSKEEKTAKEKDIEAKKLAIENKRKEIQALIDKIKKARKDIKLDDIADPDMKAILTKQKETEEKSLADYEKELKEIKNPASTFFEKVKEWANKTWELAKEHPRATGGIVLWTWLLIGWMAGWFKKKKKSETGDEWGKKEKKKKSRRKKALLRWWGIFWGMLIWKNWDKISFWFKGLFGKTDPNEGGWAWLNTWFNSLDEAKKSFDKLPENTRLSLNTFGTNINDTYKSLYNFSDGSSPMDLDKEKLWGGTDKLPWVIPHILDNSFTTIDDLQSQMGLFKVDMYGDISEISKTLSSMIGTALWKLAETILSMVWFSWVLTWANVEESIRTFLSGTNTKDDIRLVFRRIYKTMSYTAMIENVVVSKSLTTSLQSWKSLYKKSGDKWTPISYNKDDPKEVVKLTKDIFEHQQEYKLWDKEVTAFVIDVFRGKKLRDLAAMNISQQDIDTYNPYIKEIIQDYNKKRDVTTELLNKDKNKALDHLKDQVQDELWGWIYNSITKAVPYAHLLEIFGVGNETQLKNKIFSQWGYTKIFEEYEKSFEDLKKQNDTVIIQKKIDAYYAYIKEVSVNSATLYAMQDKHDNLALNIITPVVNVVTGAYTTSIAGFTLVVEWAKEVAHGVNEVVDKNYKAGLGEITSWSWNTLKGWFYLSTGGGTLITLLGLIRWSWWMSRFGLKLALAPIFLPTKYGMKLLAPATNANIANILPSIITARFYTTPKSLVDAIWNGMSTETALTIFQKMAKNAWSTTEYQKNFITKVLQIADDDDIKMVDDLIWKKRFDIIDNMMNKSLKWFLSHWLSRYTDMNEGLKQFRPIYDLLKVDKWSQEFWYALISETKMENRSKVKDILLRGDIMNDVKSISSADDINLLAKNLWSSLDKVDVVDDIFAQNCKNVINSLDEIKKSSGTWFGNVMKWLLEKVWLSKKVLSSTEISDEAKIISEQMTKISWVAALDDATKVSLNLEKNATAYSHLLEGTDNIDDLTRKILHERNIADKKDYFSDVQKIAEAKSYAQFLMDSRKVGTAIEYTKDLTPISGVLNIGDYNKLAKLINKGKSDDIVKFLTKRLDKEWVENAGELAQKFADQTKGMQNADKTEVAKIIGLSEKNTEKAIIAITKSLAKDKVFVTSILGLNGDTKAIAEALNNKCGLIGTNATIAEDSELVQKLAKCPKSQDVEKALQYTSKGLNRRIGISGATAALAIAGAVMSIIDTVHAFNLIETTNNEDLKDVYRQRGYVSAWFAAMDTLVAVDATCELAYLAFSIGEWAFMSTGVGAVIVIAAQWIRYLYDQYSLWAEFQAKNAEDRKKEWLWLYFIWYYRSGGKTSWENVKDTFGSATDAPLANIVEWLIDQTLGIQEWAGTPDQQRVKWYMKEYMTKKYNNKVEHMESGFSMMSEALEYATFAEYMNNIKNWTVKKEQITWDMADFMSKYPTASNQNDLIAYFNKYKEFTNVQQTQNLEKYRSNLQKYSEQELTFIYEQLGRYNDYYTLPVEWISLLNAVRTLLKEKNVDTTKLQLNFEEPPTNREQIEKFISTLWAEWDLQESVGDASEVKGKIDQVIISDEDLIEKYWAVPTLEIYTFLKIARIFGYTGDAGLEGIKIFLSEETKDRHGVYRNWKEWKINNIAFRSGFRNRFGRDRGIWIGDEAVKNLKNNIDKIDFDDKYLWAFDSAGIKVKFNQLREDIDKKIELDKMQSIAPVSKAEIVEYLKNNNWKYTLLSIQLLSRLLQKNAIKNSGHYLFKYENNKIIALSLDTQAKEKLFFVDEIDTSSSSKFKYEMMTELDAKPMINQLQDLRKIINLDNDEFDVKQNPAIEKIIADKEMEIQIFMSNLNNYDKPKQKELYYKKLEEVEAFHQSFLISFLSQAADNTFSNDVDEDDADEKILQATKYGERQNFNTVIVNKYKKEYNVLQLSEQELTKFNTLEGWIDYINYYYRGISLAMFKSYVLYQENGQFHAQGNQNMEINELEKNLWDIKPYKEYMKQFKWKETSDDVVVNFSGKIQQIKTIK